MGGYPIAVLKPYDTRYRPILEFRCRMGGYPIAVLKLTVFYTYYVTSNMPHGGIPYCGIEACTGI